MSDLPLIQTGHIQPGSSELKEPEGEAISPAVLIMLVEYDSLQRTIDQRWQLGGQLIGTLIVFTGAAVTIVAQSKGHTISYLLLISSMITNALAWSIQSQYWAVIRRENYIADVLAPATRKAAGGVSVSSSLLGWDEFLNDQRNRSRLLYVPVNIAGFFVVVLTISPSIGFLAAATWYLAENRIPWVTADYVLAAISLGMILALLITLIIAFRNVLSGGHDARKAKEKGSGQRG